MDPESFPLADSRPGLIRGVAAGIVAMALAFAVLWWGREAVFPKAAPVPIHPPLPDAAEIRKASAAAAGWILRHQAKDGRWSFRHFKEVCADPACDGEGDPPTHEADEAATGLALFALQAVETANPAVKEAAGRGLSWLLSRQDAAEGSFGKPTAFYSEYNTAFPVLALLAEARPEARPAIEKALPYFLFTVRKKAHSDDSIGLSLLALRRAKARGFDVDPAIYGEGLKAIEDKAAANQQVTSAGIFFRLLGDPRADPIGKKKPGLADRAWAPLDAREYDLFSAFFRGETGRDFPAFAPPPFWIEDTKLVLMGRQRKDGHPAGSWDPVDAWGAVGGRLYATSCALRFLARPDGSADKKP